MKVLIVGAGIGGPTLNAFLTQSEADIEVDVIERAPDWSDRHGYSLGIWDNGRDILRKLGLEDRFDAEGTHVRSFYLCNGKGDVIREHTLSEFYVNYGSAYTHLNRQHLHEWLLEKGGRGLVMGTTISDIQQKNGGVLVRFSTGEEKEYDLVVGADGIHSEVRKRVFGTNNYEHYSEWRAWFLWTDARFKTESVVSQYVGPKQFISVFDDGDKTLCVLIAPVAHTTLDNPSDRIGRLTEQFKDCGALVPGIFDSLDPKDITPTDLASVHMKKLYAGNVVLVGDAGHALEPFAGMGASMAMEDAYVLAGELIKVSRGQSKLSKALAEYERRRTARVKRARKATCDMRWWALTRSRVFYKAVEALAPIMPPRFFTKRFHELLQEEI